MADLIGAAFEWAVSAGPPNWVFVLALITTPATWSNMVRKRIRPLLDRMLPGKEGNSAGGE